MNPATGRRSIVFDRGSALDDVEVRLPCGRCAGCRLEQSRQWAVRCMHEASLHDANAFITLTYRSEELPPNASLDRRAFPLFMKRLRKSLHGERVRYFHAGEYGSMRGRPHYHACLFGYDFPDKVLLSEGGAYPTWRSETLERLWPFGMSHIGAVTFESAAYVARYMLKGKGPEVYDGTTGEVLRRVPEYVTMSRRPGIGAVWFSQFGKEVFPSDSVLVRGRLSKPPRFYFNRYELADPLGAEEVRLDRVARRRREDETRERLDAREAVALAKVHNESRRVE